MNNVRAKKSRKRRRVNSTKMGYKRKRRVKQVKIVSQTVAKAWDKGKTVKQNFSNLGLAFNSNSAVPLLKRKGTELQGEETMEIDKPESSVIREFEEMASVESKTERHISPGEAQFLFNLVKDHGDNYKEMARDKRNYYQHTAKQLKRKCQSFLSSSQDFSEHLKESS